MHRHESDKRRALQAPATSPQPATVSCGRYHSLSADNQRFIDQLASDIIRDSLMIHATQEKYVSNLGPRRRARSRRPPRKERAVRSRSELRGSRPAALFAALDLPRQSPSPRCVYVSLHDLPSAASFSYKDDTVRDSLEDLIADKVRQIQDEQQQQSILVHSPDGGAEVSRALDFAQPSSPIRSQKGRERLHLDPDFDAQYDEYFNSLSSFKPTLQDQTKGLSRTFSFTERIISCNLKHHKPDDFDVESLTITVKRAVRAATSADESQLNPRNLPLYLTSLNLSRNELF